MQQKSLASVTILETGFVYSWFVWPFADKVWNNGKTKNQKQKNIARVLVSIMKVLNWSLSSDHNPPDTVRPRISQIVC